jgi:cell wall-associated NlpC family hydrolase
MRRNILGPVCMCLLVIMLIGTDFGQTAQAKANKEGTKTVAAKGSRHQSNADDNAQMVVQAKKHGIHKKKAKAKARLASGGGHKHKKKMAAARKLRIAKGKQLKVAAGSKHKATGGKKLRTAKAHHRHSTHVYAHNSHKRSHSRAGSHARTHEAAKPQVKIAQALPVQNYQILAPKPSDLYLAKANPDTDNPIAGDAKSEKRLPMTIRVLELAYRCLGIPYRHGGTTTRGFDCSGFVKYVFKENGIELGRSSRDQAQDGVPVTLAQIKPGDLIFFRMHQRKRDRSHIDHVGLYVGNGQFIHAASSTRSHEIKVDSLESSHFLPKVVEARRILDDDQDVDTSLPY